MAEQVTIGQPPIAVEVRRNARARRFSLRISATDGTVRLTMPPRAAMRDALAFAQTQEAWLRQHLDTRPTAVVPALGGMILLDGREMRIAQGQGRRVTVDGDTLRVPGRADLVPGRLRGFLQALARDRLSEASERYAVQVGREFTRLTLRDTRSRWGSCTSDGGLMYSWRLVMAPRPVLEYVAAHEVCHLVHLDHSPAYWAEVARVFPDHLAQRQWLRDNGALLHRYRF